MPVIEVRELTHIYCPGTVYEKRALDNVSFSIGKGEFFGIAGANGSGKSTLIQHFNGLLRPTSGRVVVAGKDTNGRHNHELWREVGLIFQFPEQQLFEATVFADVAFGPKNLGLDQAEIVGRVHGALRSVGLDPAAVGGLSPLRLSGGAQRLVAIAGVLAMRAPVLVLDEPTAGLDPAGRRRVMEVIRQAQQENQTTVVMVSHSLRELIACAGRLAVLARGKLLACGPTEDVLGQQPLPTEAGLVWPEYLQVLHGLAQRGRKVRLAARSAEEAVLNIERMIGENGS